VLASLSWGVWLAVLQARGRLPGSAMLSSGHAVASPGGVALWVGGFLDRGKSASFHVFPPFSMRSWLAVAYLNRILARGSDLTAYILHF